MNYEEIKKIIDEMGSANINELNLEFPEGVKISMKKNSDTVFQNKNIVQTSIETPINNTEILTKIEEKQEKQEKQENHKSIKSPMVGTFYGSSTPTSKPFVKVGDIIKRGQVVCIIEAMKLMNEIESEYDGEITEICAKNEDVVEYGRPLFKIK